MQETDQGTVAVLGAGLAGLAAADRLARAGRDVVVIDEADTIGGAHRSARIGGMTFDAGSIFYEDRALIFRLAPHLEGVAPVVRRIQRRIDPAGGLRHYPLEPRDVLGGRGIALLRAGADMMASRLLRRRDGSLDALCYKRLGRRIYEGTGLRSYIRRFHHVPPSEVDEEFFYGRMGFIAKASEMRAMMRAALRMLRRQPYRRGAPAVLMVRPAAGFEAVFDPMRADLEARGVRFVLGARLEAIETAGAGFVVTADGQAHAAAAVVNALPLDAAYRAVFGTPTGLRSLDLMTLYVSAGQLDPEAGNVLFNFHPEGRWKRLTVYSRIYPELMAGREFFSVEITLPPGQAPDPEAGFADFRAHLEGLGIARDLRLEGHTVVPDAYPLYAPGYGALVDRCLQDLTRFGIVNAGRQGRFEYLPTSSLVIRRVAEELDRSGLVPAKAPAA